MKKLSIAILMLSGAGLFTACNGNNETTETSIDSTMTTSDMDTNPATNTVSEDASDFVKEAAKGGMMKVELGKIAQQKAKSQAVKDFGQMMVDDHSAANDNLKQVAAKKSILIPDSLTEDEREEINELSKKSGSEFDKAYVDMMVDDHQKDVDKFKEAANNINDPEIKNFAQNTLPTLQKHLDRIKEINSKM